VEVAKTISGGLVDEALITPTVVFAGLVGAILWNLVTWMFGLPSSSSHALIGGLVGAAVVGGGLAAVQGEVLLGKVVLPAVVSPVLAGLVALAATRSAYRITARADAATVRHGFRLGQVAPASTVALAHGANDAQKTMGVITLALIAAGALAPGSGPPSWVVLAAGLAIALGTYARWLADHPDAGPAGQRHRDDAGVHRRDHRRLGHPRVDPPRHSSLDDPHLHRRGLRGRRGPATGDRPLEHGGPDRRRVGPHRPRRGARRRGRVLGGGGGERGRARGRGHGVTAATVNDFPEPDQPVRVAA